MLTAKRTQHCVRELNTMFLKITVPKQIQDVTPTMVHDVLGNILFVRTNFYRLFLEHELPRCPVTTISH